MKIIAPSILSADFGNLQADIEMLNASRAEWLHVDVMDGVFVPNISFGFPVMNTIKKHSTKFLDVHLMIVEPEKYVQRFAESGADLITFHIDATQKPLETINLIRTSGKKAGVTINPNFPVSVLETFVEKVDLILLMAVYAGFGGQKFIEETYSRIEKAKCYIAKYNPACILEIDGGVNLDNAPKLFAAGADVLVAGNAVFKSADPTKTIEELLEQRY